MTTQVYRCDRCGQVRYVEADSDLEGLPVGWGTIDGHNTLWCDACRNLRPKETTMNKRKTTGRSAFDSQHVKSVMAWGLVHPDRPNDAAGRIVAVWGSGGGCTCTVHVWAGPLYQVGRDSSATGRAGGHGYCKFSAAAAAALEKLTGEHVGDMAGSGPSAVRKYFESHGYTVIEVISAG